MICAGQPYFTAFNRYTELLREMKIPAKELPLVIKEIQDIYDANKNVVDINISNALVKLAKYLENSQNS
jgi:hypothetical protein